MAVSAQDRVMSALLLGAPPLLIAAVATAMGAKAVGAVFTGLGIAGGVVGAVGAEWFQGKAGTSPLAQKGWADGYPVEPTTAQLVADVNSKLRASGGYEYDPRAFEESTSSIVGGGQKSATYQPDDIIRTTDIKSQPLSGIGGFWALR